MNKQYTEIEFFGYISGDALFPDELPKENESTKIKAGGTQNHSNTEYVSPSPDYLKFPRWKDNINN